MTKWARVNDKLGTRERSGLRAAGDDWFICRASVKKFRWRSGLLTLGMTAGIVTTTRRRIDCRPAPEVPQ